MSFDIARSSILSVNRQLDTISNNIANAGTVGFKSARANFAAAYAGSQAAGVQVASVTQSHRLDGGVASTGRTLDAAIGGRGLFVVQDSTGLDNYTRVGIFSKNASDLLVDTVGRRVQGFALTPPSTTPGALGDIRIPTGVLAAKPSATLAFVANLSPDWTAPTVPWVDPDPAAIPPVPVDPNSYNWSRSSTLYDSLGGQHMLTQYFIATDSNTVEMRYTVDGQPGGDNTPVPLAFDENGQLTAPATLTLSFTPAIAAPMTVVVDYTGSTLQSGATTTSRNAADGYASGTYTGVVLGADGIVSASYSNGQTQAVAQLALATFTNDDGLVPVDDTSWTASHASGAANLAAPGAGVTGNLSAASLEQSNVDLTSQLVEMMTAQRNFQATSKMITTESQVLQALVQAV